MKKKSKRTVSQKQLNALAKGRAKLASKKASKLKIKPVKETKKVNKNYTIKPGEKKVMATEKKAKKRVKSSISKVRGTAKSLTPTLKTVTLAVGGAVAAGAIANKLPLTNTKLKAAAPLLFGVLLSGIVGRKNAMVKEIGTGMAVIGAMSLLKQYLPNVPVLAGEDTIVYIPEGYIPQQNGEYTKLGYSGETIRFGEEERYLSPASM